VATKGFAPNFGSNDGVLSTLSRRSRKRFIARRKTFCWLDALQASSTDGKYNSRGRLQLSSTEFAIIRHAADKFRSFRSKTACTKAMGRLERFHDKLGEIQLVGDDSVRDETRILKEGSDKGIAN